MQGGVSACCYPSLCSCAESSSQPPAAPYQAAASMAAQTRPSSGVSDRRAGMRRCTALYCVYWTVGCSLK